MYFEPFLIINILDYLGDIRQLCLICKSWYNIIKDNSYEILTSIRNKYSGDTINDIVFSCIKDTPGIIRKLMHIIGYIPISWDLIAKLYVNDIDSYHLILPRISVREEYDIRNRLSLQPWKLDISSDRYESRIKFTIRYDNIIPSYTDIILDDIHKHKPFLLELMLTEEISMISHGWRTILKKYNMRDLSHVEHKYPSRDKFLDHVYMDIGCLSFLEKIGNSIDVNMERVSALFAYTDGDPSLEMEHIKLLRICIINGYDHLLDKYMNVFNVDAAIASCLCSDIIHPKSWRYLQYASLYPEWYKYYQGGSKPIDMCPSHWRTMITKATMLGNINLVARIAFLYRNKMNHSLEAEILGIAIKHGTYSDGIMYILKSG